MTTPEALNALAYRCEAEFDVMSSPLDADIALAVGWTFDAAMPFWWRAPDSIEWVMAPPPYTTSLDAAVTLLPERAEWDLTTLYGVARVAVGLNIDEGPHYATHEGGILPMAICAAALRARAADMQARAEDGAPHPSPSGNEGHDQ